MLRIIFSLYCLCLYHPLVLADVKQGVTPVLEKSIQSKWKAVKQGFSLEIVQVSADYVRAVFGARGLPHDVVEDVSTYCVFGTIIKNQSNTTISARLSSWRIVTGDGVKHKLKLKSDWVKEWSAKGVGFRWLLLSDKQTFDEGDWIQGFSTIALPPGSRFDLNYSWSRQGKVYNNLIKGIQCAIAPFKSK